MHALDWIIPFAVAAVMLFPYLYLRLFHVNIPRMQRRFRGSGRNFFSRRFPLILHAFLTGNNRAAAPIYDADELSRSLDRDFDAFYRGFAYEGTGLAFGARAWLRPKPGRHFEYQMHRLAPKYLYQYYVGLGWFLHMRYGFRFGGYRRWLRTLDPRYAAIVFDGVGFKTFLFQYLQNKEVVRKFSRFDRHYQRVCFQGAGRALWFLHEFDLNKAIAEIQYLPSAYRQDVYSGLGLAVAYSIFDNMAFSEHAETQVPACYRLAFRQGLAFGWEARRLQDRDYWEQQIDKQSPSRSWRAERCVKAVHQAREMLDADGAGANDQYYARWMDETRIRMGDIA